MDDIIIRKYKNSDFGKVLKIEKDAFGILANPLEIKLSSFISTIYVIEKSNEIIGAVFFINIGDLSYACNAALKQEFRNKKVAQTFGPLILDQLKKDGIRLITAMIQSNNKASLKMSVNIGFKKSYEFKLPFLGDTVLVYKWL